MIIKVKKRERKGEKEGEGGEERESKEGEGGEERESK